MWVKRVVTLMLGLLLPCVLFAAPGDGAFRELVDKDWAFRLKEFPALASEADPHQVSVRLNEVSESAQQRRLAFWTALRSQVNALDATSLSVDEQINRAILLGQLNAFINDIELGGYLMPINSDSAFYSYLPQLPSTQPFTRVEHYRAYLAKLNDFPRFFAEHRANLEQGIVRGMTVPQVVLQGRDAALRAQANLRRAEDSVYYTPFKSLPAWMNAAQQATLRREAKKAIEGPVTDSYADFLRFFNERYVPAARTSLAATALPKGAAFYQAQIAEYTTLDLTPEAIHQIGLREVARIRGEMLAVMNGLKYPGSFAEFLQFLRSDPQFYAKTPRELLRHARDIAKRIDAQLPAHFGLLPRQPYGVVAVPEPLATSYTAGRYSGSPKDSSEAAHYWVNTSKLSSRPLYALPALTLHEAVPGHHLQIALAAEQAEQPPFRRLSYISAYGEGWALYAEYLGVEMGIYETPYEQFGRLTYEMWRAARLVVDTGIHAKHWSRAQALSFMRDHTALSLHEIETEIDRYISWPGQALSYKLGELKIRELRSKAETTLGRHFDRRAFHDALLALGSVPLPVLEQEMNAWIDAQASKP